MEIGILTFHRAENYGAQLQAFALSQTLMEMGHQVEFVDYRQPKVEGAYRLISFRPYRNATPVAALKIFISRLMTFGRRAARHNAFKSFSKMWIKTSPVYNINKPFKKKYDALVFGSDQIWTTRFLGGFDPVLWGNINIESNYKIPYAPSMEMKTLTQEQQAFCQHNLSNFSTLSVREETMRALLSPLTLKNIEIVLDPVFLRNKTDYQLLAKHSDLILPDRYVFLYTIGKPNEKSLAIANMISSRMHLPLIILYGEVGLRSDTNRLDAAGPYDFLKTIAGADFVVTTSFHGTAFSVIFEKKFYSIKQEGISGRAESLLADIGLTQALISTEDEVNLSEISAIDYVKVNESLKSLKEKSLSFLKDSLS